VNHLGARKQRLLSERSCCKTGNGLLHRGLKRQRNTGSCNQSRCSESSSPGCEMPSCTLKSMPMERNAALHNRQRRVTWQFTWYKARKLKTSTEPRDISRGTVQNSIKRHKNSALKVFLSQHSSKGASRVEADQAALHREHD
jgi:hypothetical protein